MKAYKNALFIIIQMMLCQVAWSQENCSLNPPFQDCPNDEFFDAPLPVTFPDPTVPWHIEIHRQQWGANVMHFSSAWYITRGTSRISIFDGPADVNFPDIRDNLRRHNFGTFAEDPPDMEPVQCLDGSSNCPFTPIVNMAPINPSLGSSPNHGSFILSLLGSQTNNTLGMASLCRDCSIGYTNLYKKANVVAAQSIWEQIDQQLDNTENAYSFTIKTGNEIINHSGAIQRCQSDLNFPGCQNYGTPISLEPMARCDEQISKYGHRQSICDILDVAEAREVVIVAAAGNNFTGGGTFIGLDWPANEDFTIGVGGADPAGQQWLRDRYVGDFDGVCQDEFDMECGSNIGPSLDFIAPAYEMPLYQNGDFNLDLACLDSNLGTDDDGYITCSGTSFSAPHITAVVAMIKSLNPLLKINDIKEALKQATPNAGDTYNEQEGFGQPNANLAVLATLGVVNATQPVNRLKPMFALERVGTNNKSYLHTSIPQVAVAAIHGTYLSLPGVDTGVIDDLYPYQSVPSSKLVNGYNQFPAEGNLTTGPQQVPRAPFYLFGGHRNPFDVTNELKPLHHFGWMDVPGCDDRDHAYAATEASIGYFTGVDFCPSVSGVNSFVYEGIEGYMLPDCSGLSCYPHNTSDQNALQCLKLRVSDINDQNGFALILEKDINNPEYASYVSLEGSPFFLNGTECLGYVFPNHDSDFDNLIDGIEIVLGTDPMVADSDCDGLTDGVEYPLTGLPVSDPLDNQCAPSAVDMSLVLQETEVPYKGQPIQTELLVNNPSLTEAVSVSITGNAGSHGGFHVLDIDEVHRNCQVTSSCIQSSICLNGQNRAINSLSCAITVPPGTEIRLMKWDAQISGTFGLYYVDLEMSVDSINDHNLSNNNVFDNLTPNF